MKKTKPLPLFALFTSVALASHVQASPTSNASAADTNSLMVNGTTVLTLTGSTKDAAFKGNASIAGNQTVAGMVGIGTTSPQTTLDVNGPVTIRGMAILGSDCTSFPIGTLAQDGTGKLLSCQTATAGSTPPQSWNAIAAGTSHKYLFSCTWHACYALDQKGEIYRSDVGTMSWTGPTGAGVLPAGVTVSAFTCSPYGATGATDFCYAIDQTGKIYRSESGGVAWLGPTGTSGLP